MSKPIEETERCQLFEEISKSVWHRIIRAHEVDVDLKEVGITADILVDIQQFNKNKVPNFDLYARAGWEENIYGSDLDVYVETSPNKYRWFALQAKLLKKSNKYDTLRDNSDGIMQWDKLAFLEAVSGCKSYYLLYNGRNTYTKTGHDTCGRAFSPEQFGCSLVETNKVIPFATRKNRRGTKYRNPTFEEFHPLHSEPWRILVCCYLEKGIERYSLSEIVESNPMMKKLEFKNSESKEEEASFEGSEDIENKYDVNALVPFVENNRINEVLRKVKWNPALKYIVHRTDNLE